MTAPPNTATEATAAQVAHELQDRVKAAADQQRATWVQLAGTLHAFHAVRAWEALGVESFATWLADPDVSVGVGRSHAYQLIQTWQDLVIERAVPISSLVRLDVSKVATVLPAIRIGRVAVEDAIDDVLVLSKSDLKAKYGSERDEAVDGLARRDRCECPVCGHEHARKATER